MITTPQTRRLQLTRPLDLRLTLSPTRIGRGDPCTRLRSDQAFRATRTPDGPATVHLVVDGVRLGAEAWGPGAEWLLDQLPVLVGEADVDEFRTDHPLVAELHRRMPGLRIGATHRLLEALVAAVCAQGVSSFEAKRCYRQLMEAFGEPAPGPSQIDLLLPPSPQRLASAGYQDLHTIGLERRRADVIRRAAARAVSVEALVDVLPEEAEHRLRSLACVSVWTASLVRAAALGDPDAVPVGDPQMKHLVAFALTGERRGTDARMLELLEPFRGHRGRVARLIRAAGLVPR